MIFTELLDEYLDAKEAFQESARGSINEDSCKAELDWCRGQLNQFIENLIERSNP